MLLYSDLFYRGVSIKQVLGGIDRSPNHDFESLNRHYFGTLGVHFILCQGIEMMNNYNIKYVGGVRPSHELVSILLFDSHKYWAGTNVRIQESVSVILGAVIANRFDLSYAYDVSHGKLRSVNYGSHEIILEYKLTAKEKIPCPDQFW